ncbi:uncharacterized protein LOC114310225 [Camellia sinensis]|uniref:uncharacterized protein LOC114310225 n=1 Tax=Camellia sinensis TaxID=4442 RepID=UPI0010363B1C|nr:uncharacterized protein LOC114310225 [Camellia sinensis]
MRGQGYDGANNMCGEWNGLQALFLKDCPYAYYVHCFAHRLQLALIATTKDEPTVWQFFSHLSCIVNLVASSPNRLGELKSFHRSEVENMLSVNLLLKVSRRVQINKFTGKLMKTQDILNAMKLVSTTKALLQKLRQDDWDIFLANVVSFCNRHNIAVRDMSSPYKEEKFYPQDFTSQDIHALKFSTPTTARAFSGLKHAKTTIHNTIGDEFLADCLSLYLERDLTLKIDLDSIIDEFKSLKTHRPQLC